MVDWKPMSQDFHRVYAEQNLWRFTGGAVHSPPVLPREESLAASLAGLLLDANSPRNQLLVGPRRVGKTVVLYQTVRQLLGSEVEPERICWLRMDHPALSFADLGELLRGQLHNSRSTLERPLYLVVDEIGYVGKWGRDHLLDSLFPEHGSVRIAAASSSMVNPGELRKKIGAGTFDVRFVPPYSFVRYLEMVHSEAEAIAGPEPASTLGESLRALPAGLLPSLDLTARLREFVLVGGFPELLETWSSELRERVKEWDASGVERELGGRNGTGPEAAQVSAARRSVADQLLVRHLIPFQQVLRRVNVEQVLYRDLRLLLRVKNPQVLERLLYVLATQVGTVLSPTRICSYLGISQPTFDRYLSYLEQAFLVIVLPSFPRRGIVGEARGRKLYFVDDAVRNAVLQRGLVDPDDSRQHGLPPKNLIISELRSLAVHCGARLYHWRRGDRAVDVIFDHPDDPLAFEIASSPSHTREGLHEFARQHEQFRGRCYLVAPGLAVTHPPDNATEPGTLPLETLLVAVGTAENLELRRGVWAA